MLLRNKDLPGYIISVETNMSPGVVLFSLPLGYPMRNSFVQFFFSAKGVQTPHGSCRTLAGGGGSAKVPRQLLLQALAAPGGGMPPLSVKTEYGISLTWTGCPNPWQLAGAKLGGVYPLPLQLDAFRRGWVTPPRGGCCSQFPGAGWYTPRR